MNTVVFMSSICCEFAWLLQRILLMLWGECELPRSCSDPATNCANRLLLPEMLSIDVYYVTTHSCKKSCLLAISAGKCQILISYSTRKEPTLSSYGIAEKEQTFGKKYWLDVKKGTKLLPHMYGYYTTWHVIINKLGLGIPQAEGKVCADNHQEKDCWSCSTDTDSIRSLTDECFLQPISFYFILLRGSFHILEAIERIFSCF